MLYNKHSKKKIVGLCCINERITSHTYLTHENESGLLAGVIETFAFNEI